MKILTLLIALATSLSAQIPAKSRQVIIGIAESWGSSHVTLSMFEKNSSGQWQIDGKAWKGRLGRNGLAWGLGIHPIPTTGLIKKEGDGKAPAGIFSIGTAYGYAKSIKKRPSQVYRRITTRDLWVEDSSSPHYNSHLVINYEPRSAFEKAAQMRQNDYAHSLKLFIGHNAPTATKRAIPRAGSAIFFHIWRGGGSRPTAGCTTMHPDQLKLLISKIDPAKQPVYILLPKAEYLKLRTRWKLP
mgnify:CR=1 FL=1